ncbi:MAG: acetyl-CoA carboxylase biotin carboxylase subunit [Bacilli bacterium]
MDFPKLLIANRGEIARRIIRTCRRLEIATVAVYSEADQNLPYVREADESVLIGTAQAVKSYLNIDSILDAAAATGATAIHPGYGFLSENAGFAKRCREAELLFVGPDSSVIEAMGSKIHARRRMKEAGVPIVPGYDGPLESVDEAVRFAAEIGYPLMLKASAGGGGIGMQLVSSEVELRKVYDSTMQKAVNFFGDGAVFLEKWIAGPRHIEVQVAGDSSGNVVHLFERECSVQRRHQKVIEECWSPFIDEAVRERLYSAAIRGAKSIGYTNVGTMEFIFDGDGNFYFLEMNTRLQVEHPVTEMITGLDLVELQLRIAAGENLPWMQADINASGHALEARVYAEDPKTFFPSPGVLVKLNFPEALARFDFGYEEGSTVSPYYDSLVGKVIVHGANRLDALERMRHTLQLTRVEGIKTNIPLLLNILDSEQFLSGKYTTSLVADLLSE